MAKKRPKIDLAQAIQPRSGDLEKLFATEDDTEQASGWQLLSLRIDAIIPDTNQPRSTFPHKSLEELSESIKQEGVIQPIEVAEIAPQRFKIVHGERRWRAAQLAGLETIPAVVRRRDYDTITRFVRQLVENIQREDLNDVDRASGLLHLRELMQEELDAEIEENPEKAAGSPWARTITWAKVGKKLGMSRQRIHQLIQLLNLPDEIKEDIREGKLSERDTRIYQGLQVRHQRDLHHARFRRDLEDAEIRRIVEFLREEPGKTVSQIIRELKNPLPPRDERPFDPSLADSGGTPERDVEETQKPLRSQPWGEGTVLPPRQARPTNIDRLDWIRGHLARIQREGLGGAEKKEILRLLSLIQQDVATLRSALEGGDQGTTEA